VKLVKKQEEFKEEDEFIDEQESHDLSFESEEARQEEMKQ
jgi:hypothetical protein